MRKTILSSVAGVLFPFAAHGAQTCYGGYGGYQRRSSSRLADGHIGSLPIHDPAVDHSRPDPTTVLPDELEIAPHSRITELVVVDAGVLEHEVLHSHARPGIETVVLDRNQDTLAQLLTVLGQYTDLSAVHLVSHGEADALILGGHRIGKDALAALPQLMAALNAATRSGADLLLYACNLARDNDDLLEIVRNTTHLDIAASSNPTGAANLGGDWELEIHSGTIETKVAFSETALRDFSSVLAPNGTKTFGSFTTETTAINPSYDFGEFTAYIKSTQPELIGPQEGDLYVSMYNYDGNSAFYIRSSDLPANFAVTQLIMRSSNTAATATSVHIYGFATTNDTTPIASKQNIAMPGHSDQSSVTVDLTSGITGSFANIAKLRITPVGDAFSINSITFAPGVAPTAPEIAVTGNSIAIADGDSSPSAADHTDFGSTAVAGGTVDRTFTITNSGDAALSLSGNPRVAVSGTHAADFTVTSQPTTPVATGGGTTTFTVRFDPSASGVRTATLSLANDDADENPYNFSIQGTGTADTTAPTVESIVRQLPAAQDVTELSTVTFRVTFSEPVQNVTAADFQIQNVATGNVAGTIGTPSSIGGDASIWDVPVTLTGGEGEFRLIVVSAAP